MPAMAYQAVTLQKRKLFQPIDHPQLTLTLPVNASHNLATIPRFCRSANHHEVGFAELRADPFHQCPGKARFAAAMGTHDLPPTSVAPEAIKQGLGPRKTGRLDKLLARLNETSGKRVTSFRHDQLRRKVTEDTIDAAQAEEQLFG